MDRLKYVAFVLVFTPALFSQTVTVDWAKQNLVSSPAKINKKTQAQIDVQNVNDVLYTYSVQLTGAPRADDDFSTIAKAFVAGKAAGEGAETNPCDSLVKVVQDAGTNLGIAEKTFYQLPENQSKSCSKTSPCSINIADTRTAWTQGVTPKATAASTALSALQQVPICQKTYSQEIANMQAALKDVSGKEAYLNQDQHVVSTTVTLEPDIDYTVDIKELYMGAGSSVGTPTTAKTLSVKFSPATDRLTLSAGALFSEIQNRAYTSQSAPVPGGTGTQNVLAVSGISTFSPLAVAQLNYEIPSFWHMKFGNDEIGLAASTGPVLRLGTQSNTTSFGYFAGIGLHLYHRFYIAPGVHIGQFADFPPGFSAPGQLVPSGLTTLTSVNRFTARFAFSISYKAKDFSSLGLTTSTQSTSSPQAAPSSDSSKGGKGNSAKPTTSGSGNPPK
jgi:hypothetical protein